MHLHRLSTGNILRKTGACIVLVLCKKCNTKLYVVSGSWGTVTIPTFPIITPKIITCWVRLSLRHCCRWHSTDYQKKKSHAAVYVNCACYWDTDMILRTGCNTKKIKRCPELHELYDYLAPCFTDFLSYFFVSWLRDFWLPLPGFFGSLLLSLSGPWLPGSTLPGFLVSGFLPFWWLPCFLAGQQHTKQFLCSLRLKTNHRTKCQQKHHKAKNISSV